MDYSFDYSYAMDDEMAAVFGVIYIIYYLFVIGLGLTGYILRSAGTCAIAKRRGIEHPWLAWIPVVDLWILGSISDQYRYVTRGQIKSKRKILLTLSVISAVLIAVFYVVIFSRFISIMEIAMTAGEDAVFGEVMGMVLSMLGVGLVMLGVGIAQAIVRYMALYDLFSSVNPAYNVVFIVLSIIPVTSVAEPFFIFFNRKKDLGMPPRNDVPVEPAPAEPQYLPLQEPIREPWENPGE